VSHYKAASDCTVRGNVAQELQEEAPEKEL
jgi:hypothetical protein